MIGNMLKEIFEQKYTHCADFKALSILVVL